MLVSQMLRWRSAGHPPTPRSTHGKTSVRSAAEISSKLVEIFNSARVSGSYPNTEILVLTCPSSSRRLSSSAPVPATSSSTPKSTHGRPPVRSAAEIAFKLIEIVGSARVSGCLPKTQKDWSSPLFRPFAFLSPLQFPFPIHPPAP